MRAIGNLAGALAVVAAAGMAQGAEQSRFDREWPVLVDRVERGQVAGDVQVLMDVRRDCRLLLDEALTHRQQALVRYAIAYANWRLLSASHSLDDDQRDDLGDEAVELLEQNIETDNGDVESRALLGGVWGIQITSAWRGMRFGRRATAAFDGARAIDERNPRLLLLQGIDTFHRPDMFGGGVDRAERWFRSAVGFFEAQPADPAWPDWGRADAYAWLGRTLETLGNTAGAREQYRKALDVEPEFVWVRDVLLSNLDDGGQRDPAR